MTYVAMFMTAWVFGYLFGWKLRMIRAAMYAA